jgi:hypothetical protein
MSGASLRTRIQLYLYSTPNIVGFGAALIGPALRLLGVLQEEWLLVTAAFYAAGYLVIPPARGLEPAAMQSLPFEAALEQFDRMVQSVAPQLQPAMLARLESIRGSVAEVLPRLVGNDTVDESLYTVRETIVRYIPETLANYLALPPVFRLTRVLKDGKTARDLLLEQLAMVDDQMKEVVGNVARGDVDALLANGQFLEARFRDRDFLSSGAPGRKSAA